MDVINKNYLNIEIKQCNNRPNNSQPPRQNLFVLLNRNKIRGLQAANYQNFKAILFLYKKLKVAYVCDMVH